MLEENNLIVISGKPGTFKSTLGLNLLCRLNKSLCYIDLEGNNRLINNDDIELINEISDTDEIKKCLNNYDIVLLDYVPLINLGKEDLLELKEYAKNLNKCLIVIICESSEMTYENDYYKSIKDLADLLITLNKPKLGSY